MSVRHRRAAPCARRFMPLLLATAGLSIAVAAQAQETSPATAPAVAPDAATPQSTVPESNVGTAQDAGVAPTGDAAAGDIVVTGYRRSIEESLSRKREANAFVDVITAEDIGKFPDKNVADSLQRVPGIIIDRDGGEGSRVSIRGLQSDLTLTQLNGNFIASADDNEPSRSFNYLLLPSNMIGSVDVFKSPEARLDEGGVGGTIILHTRRPLDLKSLSGFVSVEGTYADVTDKVQPQIGGQLSWKNPDETLGFLVGATYQERTVRDHRAAASSWNWWTYDQAKEPATDVNGNPYANDDAISYWPENSGATTQSGQRFSGYWAPQQVSQTITEQNRKRLGIQATAQMKPFDDFTVTANYFRFQVDDDFVSNGIQIPEWGYGNFFSGATLDKSGTIFQSAQFQVPPDGTGCRVQVGNQPPCTMETPQIYGTYSREKSVSNTFDVEGAFKRDRFEAVFKLGKTRATGGPSARFSVAAKPRVVNGIVGINGNQFSAWNFTDQSANFEFSPDLQDNINNGLTQIDLGSTNSSFNRSSIAQRYAQLDLTRRFDTFLDSLQVGAKWRDGQVNRSTGRNEWYADPATQLRYQDTPGAATTRPGFFFDKPLGNIAGGFTGNAFPAINFGNYLSYLNDSYGEAVRVDETGFVYGIGERIWAGYAQANFKAERFRGNLGLRYVNTQQTGVTSDRLQLLNDYCVNAPGGPFVTPPAGPDGNCNTLPLAQRETIVNTRLDQTRTYSDWLPSVNASFDVTDNLLLRGAVARVIARPAFTNLGSQRNLTYRSAEYAFDRRQFGEREGWSGSGGNGALNPFKAWQYDIGLEWYFKRGSVLGATAFRKDVSDFIVPLVLDVTQVVNGSPQLIQPYSTVANGSNARSQGVELYAQHTLPFGLGAQVNFTYNDTSVAQITLEGQNVGSSPLVGSAKTQINGSLFYENDRMLLRASYNRRGEVVRGLQSGLNVYDDPYEQIDLNASYNLFENFVLSASVINLTKSEQRQHLGNDTDARFISNVYSGRRAYVGVSYKF